MIFIEKCVRYTEFHVTVNGVDQIIFLREFIWMAGDGARD